MSERLGQWNYYREWAENQPELEARSFEAALRDVDFLYGQFSAAVRGTDPDPEKLGIQEMRRGFELYDRRTRRA